MDAGSIVWLVLLVLGAALIGGGLFAYRGSQKSGTRVLATAAMAAGAAMWAAAIVTVPVSQTQDVMPNPPIIETVPASATSGKTAVSGTDQQKSFKGYELYSWREGGEWRFALVTGTTRLKTFEEILASDAVSTSVDNIMQKLGGLTAGEFVFWLADRVPDTALPPDDIVEKVDAHCRQLDLQLQIDL